MTQATSTAVLCQPEATSTLRLLLTAKEAAAALAISERWLWGLTKEGRVKALRVNRAVRYRIEDLREFISSQV